MSYFDPDAILCERESIPIRMTSHVFQGAPLRRHCHVLENASNAQTPPADVATQTRLNVPVWLAKGLQKYSQVEVPPTYSDNAMRAYKAPGATRRRNDDVTEYFYDVGMHVCSMMVPVEEGVAMKNRVLGVYQQRYFEIIREAVGGHKRMRCVREADLAKGVVMKE